MPSLRQISCCIQWADTNAPFQEYGTVYGDGIVESYIAVPAHPQGFCVRLTSRGFIADGLAMVVFVDGNYQCNRVRLNLLPPKRGRPVNRTEVDFLLRQQEKSQGDGMYLGRAWRFDNHNIVSEAPQGFQESHFDDLGTIEVLVLRCRARERVDADYEGSSSGEDSDIFEDRPARDEDEDAPAAETAASAVAVATTTPAVEPELDDLPFGGLFDGASDYDPRNRRSGQWVWHQKERPRDLPPDMPPTFHAVPDTRFRTTSHMPSNVYYQPQQIPSYPTVPVSQSSKQVRFDFGSAPAPQHYDPYDRYSRSTYRQPYPAQQRPVSRERTRSTDRRRDTSPPPRPPTPQSTPYPPQNMDQNNASNQRCLNQRDTQNRSSSQQNSSSQNQPAQHNRNTQQSDNWTSNDGNQNYRDTNQTQSSGNGTSRHPSHSSEYSRSTQDRRGAYSHQEANQQEYFAQTQPTNLRDRYAYQSQNPLPHLNQSMHLPPYYGYQASEQPFPPPPLPTPMIPPSYASYMPTEGHMYPPQVMLPPEYAQPGGHPYPYWPYHHTGTYAYPQQHNSSGSLRINEELSPKNTNNMLPDNANGQGGSAEFSNQSTDQQAPLNDSDAAFINGTNNSNAANGDTSQDNAENWDGAADNQNSNETNWNDQDNNDTTNNVANDTWAASNDTSNDQNGWNNDNPQNDATNNGWDNTKNDQTSDDQQANGNSLDHQPSEPDLVALANAARDLYGPHGPYYSLRALRFDEPKPDAQEEPRYDVPKSVALKKGTTKQVQPGPGYRYYKRRLEPEYIDSMDSPYARFVFKYRTKEQLAKEIGITVDVEPTGDQEIRELQDMDKQTLVEMLMRAKTALGGKVPSPPPTPAISTTASDSGPVALEAPKLPYLKYSLPPLRPSNFSKQSTPSDSAAGSKTSLVGKENVAPAQNNGPWDSSANNSSDWNNNDNANNAANGNWGNDSSAQSNGAWDSNGSRQTSKSSGSKRAPARQEPADNGPPPRPPTPDNWNDATPTGADDWQGGGGGEQTTNW